MQSAEAIREHMQTKLLTAFEAQAAKRDDEEWRNGIPGAVLEGRISLLEELLYWIDEEV